MSGVILPPLPWRPSPSSSARLGGVRPYLVVVHRWGAPVAVTPAAARSAFEGTVSYLCRESVEVSAHVVYGGSRIPSRAAQLVEWQRKAWTQAGANSVSYSVESADAIWALGKGGKTLDEDGFAQLARIVAYICTRAGIPPVWARDPRKPGVTRHVDLGPIGGNPDGHTDPTTNLALWRRFMGAVAFEHNRGGFRPSWGRGRWIR